MQTGGDKKSLNNMVKAVNAALPGASTEVGIIGGVSFNQEGDISGLSENPAIRANRDSTTRMKWFVQGAKQRLMPQPLCACLLASE